MLSTTHQTPPSPRAGLGLRTPHGPALLTQHPALALVEVHSENYFGGGAPRALLAQVRADYPVSLHGVGLSLGGVDPLDERYLDELARLAAAVEPAVVSDHLCFTSFGGRHTHDLLPLPYTEEALDHLAGRVELVQHRLGRRLLVENLSAYLRYPHETIAEAEFLTALAARTGCGVLLDVNNVYVSSRNLGFDPIDYVTTIPPAIVLEMHLAGHLERDGLLVDTHSRPVGEPVWALFQLAARRFRTAPVIVEWDSDLPPFATLLADVRRADLTMTSASVPSPSTLRAETLHAAITR